MFTSAITNYMRSTVFYRTDTSDGFCAFSVNFSRLSIEDV